MPIACALKRTVAADPATASPRSRRISSSRAAIRSCAVSTTASFSLSSGVR